MLVLRQKSSPSGRKNVLGAFIVNIDGKPVFSTEDVEREVRALQDAGRVEFKITFAPEQKLTKKAFKKSLDKFNFARRVTSGKS